MLPPAGENQVSVSLPSGGQSRDLRETVPLTIFCLVSELTAFLHFDHSRYLWSSSHPRCVQNGNWKQHGLEHLSISLLKRRKAWRIIWSQIASIPGTRSNFLAGGKKEGKDSCRSILATPSSSEDHTQTPKLGCNLSYQWFPSCAAGAGLGMVGAKQWTLEGHN